MLAGMPRLYVTCPESAHLEEIEYELDPLGMLIRGCSAFAPGCPVTCARTCAKRLDARRRLKLEPGAVLETRSIMR
jgi:hypothetical protein